jgi:superfamily II DNA helicase RecQ
MLAALSSRDSLVVMPTGGSALLQAPALLGDAVAVVVSPLIAMKTGRGLRSAASMQRR